MKKMRTIADMIKLVGILLLMATGCGAVQKAEPVTGKTPTFIKADLARVTRKCDDSLGICRYSVLPDLGESQAGELSMLGIIFTPKEGSTNLVQSLFGFQVSSMKVRYRECPSLTISMDGASPLKKTLTYHQAMGRSKVVEGVTVELSIAELVRISKAEDVRCDLCGKDRSLRADEKVLLAHLFEMWRKK